MSTPTEAELKALHLAYAEALSAFASAKAVAYTHYLATLSAAEALDAARLPPIDDE
jgi:hypothetical protein